MAKAVPYVVAATTFVLTGGNLVAAQAAFTISSLVVGAVTKPKRAASAERQASVTTLSLGEAPRELLIGEVCTGGTLVDAFSFGGKYGTDTVTRCVAVADHALDGVVGFYVDDRFYPWTGGGIIPGFSNKLSIRFYNATPNGHDPQTHVLNAGAGWTTSDRLAGMAVFWIDYTYDEKVWPQGHPQIKFVVRGLRAYDMRFDPAFGYTGPSPQTWANRASHTYTRNAAVLRYAFTRGIYAEGHQGDPDYLLIGRGLSAEEAPPERIIAAANLCDEIVDGAARYTANGVIRASEDFIAVEEMFAAALAGQIVQREGGVEVEPGQAKAAAVTITDGALVVGEPVTFSAFLPDTDGGRINTVIPRYISPAQNWKDHSGPVRRDLAHIQADGGPRELTLPLMLVTLGAQANRCAEITRLAARLERRATIVLPPEYANLEEGDWIAWQSARHHGGATVRYRIESWSLDEKWRMRLSLREIASSVYGVPDPVEDMAAVLPAPTPVDALDLDGVSAEAITLPGETSVMPAIRLTWSVPVDAAVSAIRAEVRVVGGTDIAPTREDNPTKGVMVVTNGVGADQALQARLVPIGDPSRPVLPSVWITVSTATLQAGDVSPTSPTITAMQDAIDLVGSGVGSVENAVASLSATIYTAGTGLKARSDAMFSDINTATTGLKAQTSSLLASLNTPTTGVLARLTATESAVSGNNTAAVNRLNALEATVNTAGTGLTARMATAESAITANNSASVSRLSALEATVNTAGTGLSAKVTGLENATASLATGKADAVRVSALEAVGQNVALNKNSDFSDWPIGAAAPTRLSSTGGANITISRGVGKVGANAVIVESSAGSGNTAIFFASTLSNWNGRLPLVPGLPAYWKIEYKLENGSGPISALAFRIALQNPVNAAVTSAGYLILRLQDYHVAGGDDQILEGSIFFRLDPIAGSPVEQTAQLLLFAHQGNVATYGRVIVHKLALTAASALEVEAGVTLPAVLARTTSLETVTADLQANKAAASRVSALEATVNTAGTGLSARLATAETAIAGNNSAAVSRLSALEATVNTSGTGLTARIGTAESAISNLTTGKADASRVSALEATVNTSGTGLSARVGSAESAISSLTTGKADASRVTTIEAQINTASSGILARLTTVESAEASSTSAATSRLSSLEATVNAAGTGLTARIGSAETAITNLTTGKADATRVAYLEARAADDALNINATFGNYPNSTGLPPNLTASDQPAASYSRTTGRVSPYAVRIETAAGTTNRGFRWSWETNNWRSYLPERVGGDYWVLDYKVEASTGGIDGVGFSVDLVNGNGAGAGGGSYSVGLKSLAGANVGDDVIVEGAHFFRCDRTNNRVRANLWFWAANAGFPTFNGIAPGNPLTTAKRLFVHKLSLRAATEAEIAAGVALPAITGRVTTLETATANLATGKADASRVTSLEATVNTAGTGVTARLTTVESVAASANGTAKAIKGVVLGVGDYISGYASTNDGVTSSFQILAASFGIRDPGSGERTEYRAGNWYVYSPSENTRTRYGKAFGGDQKLVWWTGPSSVAEGAETKANAYVYMSQNTVGGLRFGGSDVASGGAASGGASGRKTTAGITLAGSSWTTAQVLTVAGVPPSALVSAAVEVGGLRTGTPGNVNFRLVEAASGNVIATSGAIPLSTGGPPEFLTLNGVGGSSGSVVYHIQSSVVSGGPINSVALTTDFTADQQL